MAIEKVKEYFKQFKLDSRIQEFSVSSATVELAAQAIGCYPDRIAKTLSFFIQENPVLIVMSGDAKIDNTKFKLHFQQKAKMINPQEVEKIIGHEVGGVCPFAVKEGVTVYLDISLKRFDTIFSACGSRNSVIQLSIPELEKYSLYSGWIDVCKNWEQGIGQE